MKNIIIILLIFLVFTQGLIFQHNLSSSKEEYDRICDAIYDEDFWIDKCYVPYKTENETLESARSIILVGLVITVLFNFKKFHFKH